MARIILLFTYILFSSSQLLASDKILRFRSLEKLTVGPYQNFQGVMGVDHQLFYTQKRHLQTHIYQLQPSTKVRRILDDAANAKEPELSFDGQKLAFTYYKYDSQGDICIIDLPYHETSSPQCITSRKEKAYSPFWLSAQKLAYVRKKKVSSSVEFVVHHLVTGEKKVLAEGKISSPTVSPDGQALAYNEYDPQKKAWFIFWKSLEDPTKEHRFQLDLPGITGIMKFSHDSQNLYFSHYLSDTNFDRVIDANDYSIIFRLSLDQLHTSSQRILPEQMTSQKNNCNFPHHRNGLLYLTCAHEGQLDIFSLSEDGLIPQAWTQDELWKAHRTARTYEERLLVINTLRYRYPQTAYEPEMLTRVLSQHWQMGETSAAQYYLEQILKRNPTQKEQSFYQLLNIYLQVLEEKQRQPVGRVTQHFRRYVQTKKTLIGEKQDHPSLRRVISAFFAYFLQEKQASARELQQIDMSAKMHPLLRSLVVDLNDKLQVNLQQDAYLTNYESLFLAQGLGHEAKIYYALNFLKALDKGGATAIGEKETHLGKLLKKIPRYNDAMKTLIDFEIKTYALMQAENPQEERAAYQLLSQTMTQVKKDYFLRKALYIRAITNLTQVDKFFYMGLIADNWLRATAVNDSEFSYAADQFSYANLDKAYHYLAQQQYTRAAALFYMGVSQIDDLESHYGMVTTRGTLLNQIQVVKKDYEQLIAKKRVGQSQLFAEALWQMEENIQQHQQGSEFIVRAIDRLEAVSDSLRNHGLLYQLLGYCYQEKMLREKRGYHYNEDDFQQAHRNFMLAMTLGQDNFRLRAAVLDNLAQLHQSVGQHDLAIAFFKKRNDLPFLSEHAHLIFLWHWSRSLFYGHQPYESMKTIEQALSLGSKDEGWSFMLQERLGFYALYAGEYQRADQAYERLFSLQMTKNSEKNWVKATLAHAYTLYKLKRFPEAKILLDKVITLSEKLPQEQPTPDVLIAFRPERLRLIAFGLLSQVASTEEQKVDYKEKRLHLLQSMENQLEKFASNEDLWSQQIIKELNQLSSVYRSLGRPAKQAESMEQALKFAQEYRSPMDPTRLRTTVHALLMAIEQPEIFSTDIYLKSLQPLVLETLGEYTQIPNIKAPQFYQQLKLALYWQGLQRSVAQLAGDNQQSVAKLWLSHPAKILAQERPGKWQELVQLRKKLNL